MTEKRFEYVYLDELGVNAIQDNVTGKHTPLSDKIADKLNELNDKKDELKRNYNLWIHRRMIDHNEVHRLEEENKELKKTVSYFADVCACSIEVMNEDETLKKEYSAIICTEMQELLKENKELKNEIKMLKTIIGKNEYYIGNITHKGKWR